MQNRTSPRGEIHLTFTLDSLAKEVICELLLVKQGFSGCLLTEIVYRHRARNPPTLDSGLMLVMCTAVFYLPLR